MPVNFRPTIRPRERILAFGVQGTGKSKALLDIARKCKADTFYIWDNDYSAERLLATSYADVAERPPVDVPHDDLGIAYGNVVVRNGDEADWEELLAWLDLCRKHVALDDWVSIDSVTATWPSVQGWFIEQVHSEDIGEYFLEVRKEKAKAKEEKKTLGALDGWMDWPVINKVYAKFYTKLLNLPCHWFLTAEQGRVSDEDDKDVKGMFGPYNVKPNGQKRLGHKPNTVLWLTKSRKGNYGMTTVKDRGRVECEDDGWEDFAKDYLADVAGWKLQKVEG